MRKGNGVMNMKKGNGEMAKKRMWRKYICNDCGHKFVVREYISNYCEKYSKSIYCPACNSKNTSKVGCGIWESKVSIEDYL